jgi:hypothetical protein
VKKLTVALLLCQIIFTQGYAFAEDYSECRARCDAEHADCLNEPYADDSEVRDAKMAACEQRFQLCYPECDQLKPIENNTDGTENNPNIIRK